MTKDVYSKGIANSLLVWALRCDRVRLVSFYRSGAYGTSGFENGFLRTLQHQLRSTLR